MTRSRPYPFAVAPPMDLRGRSAAKHAAFAAWFEREHVHRAEVFRAELNAALGTTGLPAPELVERFVRNLAKSAVDGYIPALRRNRIVPDETTRGLLFDASCYLGERLRSEVPGASWKHALAPPAHIEFGHFVIALGKREVGVYGVFSGFTLRWLEGQPREPLAELMVKWCERLQGAPLLPPPAIVDPEIAALNSPEDLAGDAEFETSVLRAEDDEWPWHITVGVMEYVRERELSSQLSVAVMLELSKVRGVTKVAREDREVWLVSGTPDRAALVAALRRAITPHASAIARARG